MEAVENSFNLGKFQINWSIHHYFNKRNCERHTYNLISIAIKITVY